ncbi:MAG: endonuclease III [Candidatus Levybacteria bacterium CG10_big_fil_rev_8_21_14_0_10_36_7]|nr:MAG: endonuclease III [Candidatus Levybacteria bacterium CG10_big_fil_rev_8_21_14_0_10_36_7]
MTHTKGKASYIVRDLKKLFPRAKIALTYKNNWQLLVAVILSAQCTDKKVNQVTPELFKKYKKLADYVQASKNAQTIHAFEHAIYQTGFYRAKTKNILGAAKVIQKEFGGKIPKTMKEILTIPGVARKTGNVVLGNAYGVVEGIAVDTHVRRLSRLFGLTRHMNPVKIERDLMYLIPKKEWFSFTYRLIDYGRKYCTARCKHIDCPLKRYIV